MHPAKNRAQKRAEREKAAARKTKDVHQLRAERLSRYDQNEVDTLQKRRRLAMMKEEADSEIKHLTLQIGMQQQLSKHQTSILLLLVIIIAGPIMAMLSRGGMLIYAAGMRKYGPTAVAVGPE